MVKTMGDNNAVLLRAHGAVIGSESIPALMVDAVHFDENAKALYDASRLGTPTPLTKGESDEFAANFKRTNHSIKLWRYYLSSGHEAGVIRVDWAESLAPKERA